MDTPVGRALAGSSTSNQWSLLTSVVAKVNRKLPAGEQVDAAGLLQAMDAAGDDELRAHGVWRSGVGKSVIVVVNPAYGRARAEELKGGGAGPGGVKGAGQGQGCGCGATSRVDKWHGSGDYNAGRHACTASRHKAWCRLWAPSTSGHLHSWRRNYDE